MSEALTTAFTTAITTVGTNVQSLLAIVVPAGLAIWGVVLAIRIGKRVFGVMTGR